MLNAQALIQNTISRAREEEPLWQPFPGKPQERAYHCSADIIGYGGAAGGGKSQLILGKGFTQFRRSYIYRRHFTDLVDLVDAGDSILNGVSSFVWGIKRSWELTDRKVSLGAVDSPKDLRKHKGRPKDFIGIDEADEFTELEVRTLMGWLRTDDPNQHTQVVLCFNPPTTPEGEWIVKFFAPWIDPDYQGIKATPGELRWYIRTKDDVDLEVSDSSTVVIDNIEYTPKSRTFFLARVDDNPIYMATGYDKQLESLPEPLRSQLRHGDFNVTAKDDIWQAIPTQWLVEAQNRYIKDGKPDLELRVVGVDPSRGGDDEFAMVKLYGTYFEIHTERGVDSADGILGARHVTDYMGNENARVFVDVIGIGSSVYDHLKVLGNVSVTPVNVGVATKNKDKTGRYGFANLRSELAWKFREALDPASGENIALPPDTQLRNDLRAAKFSIIGGKIKVESKDDIKSRIGRSPDRGDAILLAWYGATAGRLALPIILDW